MFCNGTVEEATHKGLPEAKGEGLLALLHLCDLPALLKQLLTLLLREHDLELLRKPLALVLQRHLEALGRLRVLREPPAPCSLASGYLAAT